MCTRYFRGYACGHSRDCPAHFIYCVHDWVGSVACQADLKQAEPLRGGGVGGGLCSREDVLPPAGVWPAFRKRRRSQRQEEAGGKGNFLVCVLCSLPQDLSTSCPSAKAHSPPQMPIPPPPPLPPTSWTRLTVMATFASHSPEAQNQAQNYVCTHYLAALIKIHTFLCYFLLMTVYSAQPL